MTHLPGPSYVHHRQEARILNAEGFEVVPQEAATMISPLPLPSFEATGRQVTQESHHYFRVVSR